MDRVFKAINEIKAHKSRWIIAIDGCCASGKTTLADRMADIFGAQVIHMDDFFLPPEMRTAERLTQAGGNVHYERFNEEVVKGLKSGSHFTCSRFNCGSGAFTQSEVISPLNPIIVEGAYALHPEIPDIYDLKIFLEIGCEKQLERIFRRNGSDALEIFKSKWIPFENKYFRDFDIKNKCDLVIEV